MATVIWNGTADGVLASSTGNWLPSLNPPLAADFCQFAGTSVFTCSWDLVTTVSSFIINSSYTGTIQLISALNVSSSFLLDGT